QSYKDYLATIMERFQQIVHELNIPSAVLEDIELSINSVLNSAISDEMKLDAIKALGEDSSAKIVSEYLNYLGLEASYVNPKEAGIIVSNDPGDARILPESFSNLYTLRDRTGILVIPGFFGYTKDGNLATFSRGGSDITGSIVAAGVQAELYENFTDVDSVYTVISTIVEQPKEITMFSYEAMRELSSAGFSVFHDEALIPAFNEKI